MSDPRGCGSFAKTRNEFESVEENVDLLGSEEGAGRDEPSLFIRGDGEPRGLVHS